MTITRFSARTAGIAASAALVLFFLSASFVFAMSEEPHNCVIDIIPNANGTATLAWSSDSTLFGEVTNSLTGEILGSSPDGLRIITPEEGSAFTLRAWNSQGDTITCGTPAAYYGTGGPQTSNPTVAVVTTQTPGYVTLSTIPYTGLTTDAVTILGILFALVTITTVGYFGRDELAQTLATLRA